MEAENDKKKFEITENAIRYFTKNYDCTTLDGVRIHFEDGWGLVRASNTQPVIVCRFEAKTPERLDEIKKIIMDKLNEFGDLRFYKH